VSPLVNNFPAGSDLSVTTQSAYVQTHGTAVGNSVVILHHMMEQWFQFHVLTGYGNYEIRTMIVTYVQV